MSVGALPWATILVIIFAVVGGVVVINGSLSFNEYLEAMVIAVAGLAIGRGVAARHPE